VPTGTVGSSLANSRILSAIFLSNDIFNPPFWIHYSRKGDSKKAPDGNQALNKIIQGNYNMNDLMMQLLDQFEAGLMDRTLKVMTIITDEKKRYPMELNKSQCSEMLLGTKDTTTFDERFNRHADFPRIEGKREKYPRDAVIDWYHKNWQKTAI